MRLNGKVAIVTDASEAKAEWVTGSVLYADGGYATDAEYWAVVVPCLGD